MAVQPIVEAPGPVLALHQPSLADVVALSPMAFAGFDTTLMCTSTNPRFLDLTGRCERGVRGLGLAELLPELTELDLRLARRIVDGATCEAVTTVRVGPPGQRQEQWRIRLYAVVRDARTTGMGLVAEEIIEDGQDLAPDLATSATQPPLALVGNGETASAPLAQQGADDELELTDPILDRACGLVMGRQGCTESRALLLMARVARRTNRTLQQVAADLYVAANRPASTARTTAMHAGTVRSGDRLGV